MGDDGDGYCSYLQHPGSGRSTLPDCEACSGDNLPCAGHLESTGRTRSRRLPWRDTEGIRHTALETLPIKISNKYRIKISSLSKALLIS